MTAYRLRILSGRHEGAELPLVARRYALGSGEENTLILSDDAIAEHHMSFFFADGEISILQAPGGLRIDGKAVETFPVDVAPFQIMTLAGTNEEDNISLAYGCDTPDEESVAAVSSSERRLPALRSWPERERIAALLASEGANAELPVSATKARQAKKKVGALSRLSPKKRKMLARGSLAFGVAASVSVVLVIASLLWLDPARRQATRMRQVEASLEKELRAKPVAERTVRIVQGEEGEITLVGYVETEKELVRLRGLAFESGLQIRVISKEQLRAALEVIARQYGLFAKFHLFPIDEGGTDAKTLKTTQKTTQKSTKKSTSGSTQGVSHPPFRLRLEGFIDRERQLAAFRAAITSSLPYIQEIETDITTSAAMLADLRRLLAHNAAFGGVALELEGGRLLLQGAVFANFHDELRAMLEHHYRSLPHHPLTTDRMTLVPPLQVSISALLLGRQRAVDLRLDKGGQAKRYRVGEKIDDKTIVAITQNGILLSDGKQTVGLPIVTHEIIQEKTQEKTQNQTQGQTQEKTQEKTQNQTQNQTQEQTQNQTLAPDPARATNESGRNVESDVPETETQAKETQP